MYLNKGATLSWLYEHHKAEMSYFDSLLQLQTLKDYHFELFAKRKCLVADLAKMSPLDAIHRIRSDFYDKFIKLHDLSTTESSREYMQDILSDLEDSSSRFRTIQGFIDHIETMTNKYAAAKAGMNNNHQNAVSIMSMHRSKGLQFPIVFIISVIEKIIPHKRAIDEASFSDTLSVDDVCQEECRLLYVAITRAEQELYISIPRHSHNCPTEASRFLRGAFSNLLI